MTAALYSAVAYGIPSQVESWSCGNACDSLPNFSFSGDFESEQLYVYFGVDSSLNALVIAFRGTMPEDILDWCDDLDAIHTSYPAVSGGIVAEGFWDSYQTLLPGISSSVSSLLQQYSNVLITGHSLGGALAALMGLDYFAANNQASGVTLITFGQPRVGNNAVATFMSNTIPSVWRVTHAEDPVPHVPMEVLGYWHAAGEIYYPGGSSGDPGSYQICTGGAAPAGSEDPSCSDGNTFNIDVEDHLNYLGFPISDYVNSS
eukprot:TRINITY_DN15881_c0_g1_i1.p1 TRINITY_DN15881_c0_g1~~TRINITY_DN15881_c0_g1_i1.p1  ORF type:complete len:301 (+),score=55.55 TRINITY_DN15881_c0_g1_i1:124-903(+)